MIGVFNLFMTRFPDFLAKILQLRRGLKKIESLKDWPSLLTPQFMGTGQIVFTSLTTFISNTFLSLLTFEGKRL